jgi:enoyl-CoA hydratase/carnithine racemase
MIEVSTEGDCRVVWLARPESRNALTPTGLAQLEQAVTEATAPVVLVRGRGDAFCAGADLDVVNSLADSPEAEAFAAHGQRVARSIASADVVTIAGIDGAARGGGLELALACDLRVGTAAATLGEPGVTFGLFGAWGGTIRLREVCGLGDALDLALSGRVVDAEEALRMGLLSRIVDDPMIVAEELATNDAEALRVVKRRLRDTDAVDTQEQREAEAFGRLLRDRADPLESHRSDRQH